MEKIEFNKEKLKENLVPILVGGIIFLLSVTVFKNTVTNLLKLSSENKNLSEKLSVLSKKSQLLQSLDEIEISKQVKKLEEVFPSEKPILNLLTSLNQLAQEEEVIFGGLELKPGRIKKQKKSSEKTEEAVVVQETTGLQEFDISFEIEGELENITDFTSQLEKNAPLVRIEGFSLSLDGPSANLEVRVFYQPFPESLGSIEEPVPVLTEKEKEILEEIADYRKIEAIKANAPVGKENIFSLP